MLGVQDVFLAVVNGLSGSVTKVTSFGGNSVDLPNAGRPELKLKLKLNMTNQPQPS